MPFRLQGFRGDEYPSEFKGLGSGNPRLQRLGAKPHRIQRVLEGQIPSPPGPRPKVHLRACQGGCIGSYTGTLGPKLGPGPFGPNFLVGICLVARGASLANLGHFTKFRPQPNSIF